MRGRRLDRAVVLVSLLLMAVGLAGVGWPAAQAAVNDARQASRAEEVSTGSLGSDSLIAGAVDYNERLASGQGVVGEPVDPYGEAKGDFSFADDADYQSTLDMGGGIMGVLRIPRISLELPIRHGADEAVLRQGAGHLHGTSMPVGGPSTHAVLTGHRGLEGATLFTRLDELEEGDPIYVESAGHTIAYQVDRIYPALDPADVPELLRIAPGEDRLTLVTCTPIFVNTQRLVVSARRALMPDEVAWPDEAEGDRKGWLERYWTALLAPVPVAAFVWACVSPMRPRDAESPDAGGGCLPARRAREERIKP